MDVQAQAFILIIYNYNYPKKVVQPKLDRPVPRL